ncbi:MAG: SusC/RagA family TonB-linked outer membrane protein, partial [Mucilaginibacter sp.]
RKSFGSTIRRYGYNADLNKYANYDPTTTYPNIVTGTRSLIPGNDGFSDSDNRFLSAFGNLGYTYDSRYVLTLSARKDASNLFGLTTNDKWNLLWSAGAGWNLSNEKFYHSDLLPYLKLRATYGFSGNIDPTKSAVTTIVYGLQTTYTAAPQATISQYANPELRWEKVRMINLAVDFQLKNNRIFGSIDVFFKHATDLYGPSELDYTTGAGSSITKNIASLKGSGVDIELNSLNINSKFKWYSKLNLSIYHDQVENYYDNSIKAGSTVTTSSPVFNHIIGKPLYAMYSYRYAGLDHTTGSPIGYLNGVPSQDYNNIYSSKSNDDIVYSGSAIPTLYGSIGNTLSYKRISFTTQLMYKLSYYFRRQTIDYSNMLVRPNAANPDYLLRWKKPGDEQITNIPSFVYPIVNNREDIYVYSDQTVEKGDNIRLQYINLNYQLDKNVIPSLPVKQINIYLNVTNLGIIWRANNKGIDPDFPQTTIPPSKSWTLGFKLTL